MQLIANAQKVLKCHYLLRDKNATITESPDELLQRVARAVAEAELLIKLGIPYHSDQALHLGDRLMRYVNEVARETSMQLAGERGPF